MCVFGRVSDLWHFRSSLSVVGTYITYNRYKCRTSSESVKDLLILILVKLRTVKKRRSQYPYPLIVASHPNNFIKNLAGTKKRYICGNCVLCIMATAGKPKKCPRVPPKKNGVDLSIYFCTGYI